MSKYRPNSGGARRIRSATTRLENQAYDYIVDNRTPRLGVSAMYFCCQLTSTLNAASGTWPNLTAGRVNSQTVYMAAATTNGNSTSYGLSPIAQNNSTIINYSNTTFNTGKTTQVSTTGLSNVYAVIVQDC